ncbi:MAG: transporter substrate-binding domain-containing protein [Clostridia bacterium]|nr:transporter substrate-binding domain-containing protein [Clostridia bacterium]
MKKIFALVLAVVMLATGTAFATTVDDVKASGKLVIATSPDFPPFESLDAENNPVGIEMELMALVAAELGVELDVQQMDFDSVLPGIIAGKYTVGVSGISVTDARKKNSLFTDPYCLAAQAIVVKEGSPIASKADLDGKKIAVQSGTTAEAFTMGQGYDVLSFAANPDAELALTTGKVQAWVIDDLTAKEMVDEYNAKSSEKLVVLDEPMTTEPYAFALKLGNDELCSAINDIINKLVADGTVASLFEKYEAPYTSPIA